MRAAWKPVDRRTHNKVCAALANGLGAKLMEIQAMQKKSPKPQGPLPGFIVVSEIVPDPTGRQAGIRNPVEISVRAIEFIAPRINTKSMEVVGSLIRVGGLTLAAEETIDEVKALFLRA
jgi:hypothetical protein